MVGCATDGQPDMGWSEEHELQLSAMTGAVPHVALNKYL